MKVKFVEGTRFEGVDYTPGCIYDLPEDKVAALGTSVVPVKKDVEKPQVDKMVKTAPKKK